LATTDFAETVSSEFVPLNASDIFGYHWLDIDLYCLAAPAGGPHLRRHYCQWGRALPAHAPYDVGVTILSNPPRVAILQHPSSPTHRPTRA